MDPKELEEFEFRHRLESETAPQPKQPGFMDTLKSSINAARNNPAFAMSPAGLAMKAQDMVQNGFNKLGEQTATSLAGNGVTLRPTGIPAPFNVGPTEAKPGQPGLKTNPTLAALIGTGIQMAPDIAQAVVTPAEVPEVSELAVPAARKAIGTTKAMLKANPEAAAEAARFALKRDIIPLSGNPGEIVRRAGDIADTAGSRISSIISQEGKSLKPETILNAIDDFVSEAKQGASGPLFNAIEKAANRTKQTVIASSTKANSLTGVPSEIAPETAEVIKRQLQAMANYRNAEPSIQKGLAATMRRANEQAIGDALPGDLPAFKQAKSDFGNASRIEDAAADMVAKRGANATFSPTAKVVAAAKLASGDWKGALELLGLTEVAKRSGAALAAHGLNTAARGTAGVTPRILAALSDALGSKNK